jgi:hypothetical protein
VVAPWSAFWEHNRFAEMHRTIDLMVSSPFVRGAVSGIGVVTIIAGLAELASAIVARRREPAGPPQTGS